MQSRLKDEYNEILKQLRSSAVMLFLLHEYQRDEHLYQTDATAIDQSKAEAEILRRAFEKVDEIMCAFKKIKFYDKTSPYNGK